MMTTTRRRRQDDDDNDDDDDYDYDDDDGDDDECSLVHPFCWPLRSTRFAPDEFYKPASRGIKMYLHVSCQDLRSSPDSSFQCENFCSSSDIIQFSPLL